MAKSKSNEAWLVRVTLLDHAVSDAASAGPVRCVLYGLLTKETKNCIYVCPWLAEESMDSNSDVYCVSKHAGLKIEKIRKEKVFG